MMDFEPRIHAMLDEMDGPDAIPYRFNSKYSIIEKYFKKIYEQGVKDEKANKLQYLSDESHKAMMDFEAWWSKQNDITLRMSTPEAIARAAYNQGRIDTKKECVELCTWGKTEHGERYPSVREVAKEIEKL